jgi:hypothetical protein
MKAASLLPLAGSRGMAGRPSAQAPGLDRVFIAGDWVGPRGYLLDAALASASEAAQLALKTTTGPETVTVGSAVERLESVVA